MAHTACSVNGGMVYMAYTGRGLQPAWPTAYVAHMADGVYVGIWLYGIYGMYGPQARGPMGCALRPTWPLHIVLRPLSAHVAYGLCDACG